MVCAFTGHRPEKLPWGTDEKDPRCEAVKIILRRLLEEAFSMGCRTFLCGMARGCDTYFAEAVLELRQREPEVQLIAMIPCPEQASRWPKQDRLRYETLCRQCDRCEILEQRYSNGCMLRRNKAMAERADLLISIHDGSPGGTANTVKYAKRLGAEVLAVWI